VLKSAEFRKEPGQWIYQLKNAETVPDRADAAVALGDFKDNPDVVAALGSAAAGDPFWGVRNQALRALGKIGNSAAEKQVLAALVNEQPWIRDVAVGQLGNFKDDPQLPAKLTEISASDKAYVVRAAALYSLAELKAPGAYDLLVAAVKSESPDDVLRIAGLRSLGNLGDDRAVPLLLEWAAPGKPFVVRSSAIFAVARLDSGNKEITRTLVSFLREPYFEIKFASLFALGRRDDPSAIEPLEELLKSGESSLGTAPYIEMQIESLKSKSVQKKSPTKDGAGTASEPTGESGDANGAVIERLNELEKRMDQIDRQLSKIESKLDAPKQ
jgi:HEAT repeat protein